jgi:hypothetical protein
MATSRTLADVAPGLLSPGPIPVSGETSGEGAACVDGTGTRDRARQTEYTGHRPRPFARWLSFRAAHAPEAGSRPPGMSGVRESDELSRAGDQPA